MRDRVPGLPFPDERRLGRRPTGVAGTVRLLGGLPEAARIEDVSELGCRISGCELSVRDEIWLQVGDHEPVRATVIWTKGRRSGCQFYAPVPTLLSERGRAPTVRPDRVAAAGRHPLRIGRS
jgi:hypothetical protein